MSKCIAVCVAGYRCDTSSFCAPRGGVSLLRLLLRQSYMQNRVEVYITGVRMISKVVHQLITSSLLKPAMHYERRKWAGRLSRSHLIRGWIYVEVLASGKNREAGAMRIIHQGCT